MSDTVFLTQAAEGLDRRGFTLTDVERMVEAGVLSPDEKFELVDGEIVPMNPQAVPHMLMRTGVPELWVVELNERVTYVFRGPGGAAWSSPAQVPFEDALSPLFLPGARVRMADFQT